MTATFYKNFQFIESQVGYTHFQNIKRGFEKESLRVTDELNQKRVKLANTPHPTVLGSALTHPLITTDYAENLLEFVTLPTNSIQTLFQDLFNIHHFTYHHLEKFNEYLWVSSMPCQLPPENDIPIAIYGTSNQGMLKHVYRRGLGLRYGRSMQTISGVHYNFSLPESFFKAYQKMTQSNLDLNIFISEQYLALIRNCLRFSYILPILFGASPAADMDFVKNKPSDFQSDWEHTVYGPFATSLRLSDVGYHNNTQSLVNISYNSLAEFVSSMRQAVHQPYLQYVNMGVKVNGEYQQLSDSLLQVEDEHYALVRPKRVAKPQERMLHAIEKQGIEYIEVRALDVNPFSAIGVEKEAVYLLDCFLLVCLLSDSPPLHPPEVKQIQANMSQVLKYGRKKDLRFEYGITFEQSKETFVMKWCHEMIEKMETVASLLDKAYQNNHFSGACRKARETLEADSEQLLSAQVLAGMKAQQKDFTTFMSELSHTHQQSFLNMPLSEEVKNYFENLTKISRQKQLDLEQISTIKLDDYITQYLEN